MATEFRNIYIPKYGEVVYRHFDDLKCTEEEMALVHKIAVFVCESDAVDFCLYRNNATQKYGIDAVDAIQHDL